MATKDAPVVVDLMEEEWPEAGAQNPEGGRMIRGENQKCV